MTHVLLAGLAGLVGCLYQPSFASCAVRCAEGRCPGALACGADGFCRDADGSCDGLGHLSVALDGSGAGAVTSLPPGIDCGTDCEAVVPLGAAVMLVAEPAAGARFAGWRGACAGTGACQLAVAASSMVTATFEVDTSADICARAALQPVNDTCAQGLDLSAAAHTPGGVEIAGDTRGYTSFDPDCYFNPAGEPGGDATYLFALAGRETLVVEVEPATATQDVRIWEAMYVCAQPPSCAIADALGPGARETYSTSTLAQGRLVSIMVDSPAGQEGCFLLRARVE